MWNMGRKGRGIVAAAGMFVGAAALVGASTGASAVQVPPPVLGVTGQLRLHLFGTGGTVTLEVGGAVVKTQTLSSNARCQMSTSGAKLLTFTPSAGTVGLVTNGLGVQVKNNCSTGDGRVGAGERLTVALGPDIPADVRVTTAALDIEGKFNASLGYSLDGGANAAPIVLSNSSDNGPDSGPGDNTRVTIPPTPFRSITLFPAAGELDLEGGGDYAATKGPADTILTLSSLFDFAVPCLGVVHTTLVGGAATDATFTRDLNDGAHLPSDCADIPVTLQIRSDGVLLNKSTIGLDPLHTPQAVNSTLKIVWAPRTQTLHSSSFPARQIDFDGDPTGGPFVLEDVQWCAGRDSTNAPIHPPDPRFSTGLLPWCLFSETDELQPDGTVVQTQSYDGSGDPFYK